MAQPETHGGDEEMSAHDQMVINGRIARIAHDDTIDTRAYRARIIRASRPSPRLAELFQQNAL